MAYALSEREIADYPQDGHLVVRGVLSRRETRTLREVVSHRTEQYA
jgi:hypothetical protein